ncbi:MAG: hypothetical protein ABL957_10620 [Parvularculaceae bacterium]
MPAVIVTGGSRHSGSDPHAISTDVAALAGARRYAAEHGVDLRGCFEAWIPEPTLDSRPDILGAVRMSDADGITVRVMAGRTPLGRRLAMVAGVDVVVTISGRQHTEVVVEQALELGLPVFPVPDAGGDSQELLRKHRRRIAASFSTGALETCVEAVAASLVTRPDEAATAVLTLLRTARVGKCLVLLPYDDAHDALYRTVIEPAVSRHMLPVRLDRLPKSEAIYASFADAVGSASAIVADITDLNDNVMYEVGYAHGRGLTPLIYTTDAARLDALPVYFRTLNVRLAVGDRPLAALVEEYLEAVKGSRLAH